MVKNKDATKQIFLKAIDDLICEDGFEKLGINAVASRAGLAKMLIYRYFGSLDELIAAYIKQYDFWINFQGELPSRENLAPFLKEMIREQINLLRENYALRRLYRWELSATNSVVKELRDQREKKGRAFTEAVMKISGLPHNEITILAALLNSSMSYLVLLEENCPYYNGIPIQQEKGWNQIQQGMEDIIDHWLTKIK